MLQNPTGNAGTDSWIACLTYKSLATASPSKSDLHALVGKARNRNRKLGVTGMLMYEGGSFVQTLEGQPDNLQA
ncbi:MAG: BLUF domain-containing protein, partial [Parvibaculum sp.]